MNAFIEGPVLGIETSGELTGAAVTDSGRLLGETAVDSRSGSAELLLDLTQRLLNHLSLAPRDLARIGISIGPGSFTGLRVGLGAGRALALGAGVGAVGVPSHQALALPFAGWKGPLVLLTGFRKGFVFCEAGHWEGLHWQVEVRAVSVLLSGVYDLVLPLRSEGAMLFLGESAEAVVGTEPRLGSLGDVPPGEAQRPRRPAETALLASRREMAPLFGADLARMVPLYLRAADARRPEAVA